MSSYADRSDSDRSGSDVSDRSGSDVSDRSDSDNEQPPPPLLLQKKIQIPPKKLVKTSNLEDTKKLTTKLMIHNALKDLTVGRKGVSLYAVKKYMTENYNVDTVKVNFYIKKAVRLGVETGELVQTKGVGASGSFRLAPLKTKTEKKGIKAKKVEPKKGEKKDVKIDSKDTEKRQKIEKNISTKESTAKPVKKSKVSKKDEAKPSGAVKKAKIEKEPKKPASSKTSKISKVAKESESPDKRKKKIIKRKSIGSIIKPPKMKPKGKR